MKFKKPSAELEVLLEEALKTYPCQNRKMFGSQVYFVNGNMFAGVHEDNIFLRLSLEDREKVSSVYHEVVPAMCVLGRVMKKYVTIPRSLFSNPVTLDELLQLSFEFTASLPPKAPRKKGKRS